jgi:hypothetical protein
MELLMGGLFGGFLSLINVVGGHILHVLIGSPAWKDKKKARQARLTAGTTALGSIVAGTAGSIWFLAIVLNDDWNVWYINLLVPICAGVAFAVFVLALEEVRELIDKDDPEE